MTRFLKDKARHTSILFFKISFLGEPLPSMAWSNEGLPCCVYYKVSILSNLTQKRFLFQNYIIALYGHSEKQLGCLKI